ncbi:glycosyltransferase family 4 protein [Patescibacteria group bacterium]|nr:glycosyltransferase family 4 protein [Patescibacteria group bacterium]
MKILMLTPYLPYPLLSGGQIRTYNLLKQLSGQHEVTLFALIKDYAEKQYITQLKQFCSEVRVFKRSTHPFTVKNILKTAVSKYPFLVIRNHAPDMTSVIEEYLTTKQFDLIHAETFYMMPHLPKTKVPVLLVEQTIEYLGYESFANKVPSILKPLLYFDIRKIRFWEQHYWNDCHKLIVMSADDKQLIAPLVNNPNKIEVVANGVDTNWFDQHPSQPNPQPTVLFVGTFKWLPNKEAVNFLVSEIWPLIIKQMPQAKLHIVGNAPSPEILHLANNKPSVSVEGGIPDIRTAFSTSRVLIAPVLSGKGTRYKVLEALASGTAVVATPTAVEGLKVKAGIHVMIGTTAQELANHTLDLLKHPDKQQRLAENGKRFVKKYYDWSLISGELDKIYQTMGQPSIHWIPAVARITNSGR